MIRLFSRITVALFLTMMLSACNDEKLLFNLTQEQATQVMAVLQQHNISAKKEGSLKAGYTVTVNEQESTAALSIIKQYQLPWSADIQIAQAFPTSSLVASPNAEQARVLSLQEQRLEQSLRIIAQVVNARVHVSYPPFNNSSSSKATIGHASVIITYKGEINDNMFISQIKSLIKNSFDDLNYENISVVLFPAPAIQYVAPTKVAESFSSFFIIIISGLLICAGSTAAYMFYKFKRRPSVVSVNKDDEAVDQ